MFIHGRNDSNINNKMAASLELFYSLFQVDDYKIWLSFYLNFFVCSLTSLYWVVTIGSVIIGQKNGDSVFLKYHFYCYYYYYYYSFTVTAQARISFLYGMEQSRNFGKQVQDPVSLCGAYWISSARTIVLDQLVFVAWCGQYNTQLPLPTRKMSITHLQLPHQWQEFQPRWEFEPIVTGPAGQQSQRLAPII